MLEHVYVLVVSALDNIVTGHVYVIVRHCPAKTGSVVLVFRFTL